MNIECFREVLNNLTMSEIIGDNSAYTVEELCEVFDNIKNIIKGEALKRTQITSNTPQKIMKLYAANFSPEEIADMLNLSVEEGVELLRGCRVLDDRIIHAEIVID